MTVIRSVEDVMKENMGPPMTLAALIRETNLEPPAMREQLADLIDRRKIEKRTVDPTRRENQGRRDMPTYDVFYWRGSE